MVDDFIDECMETAGGDKDIDVSVEEFEEAFCEVCINSDCRRSKHRRDSGWLERMERMERALYDPDFGDPSRFERSHRQNFETITQPDDKIHTKPGEWESVSEEDQSIESAQPSNEDSQSEKMGEPEDVHLEHPPSKTGKKKGVMEAVDELNKSSQDDSGEDEENEENPPPDQNDPEEGQEKMEKDTPHREAQNVQKGKEEEGEGIMIEPEEDPSSPPPASSQSDGTDDWSVDEDDSSGLTVNIDDGEVVDD